MAIYEGQISNRLDIFLSDHFRYEDVGDSENGPDVDSYYSGPQWALDLVSVVVDSEQYMSMVVHDNIYGDNNGSDDRA